MASASVRVLLCALAGAALAACSSSAVPELSTAPSVTANGEHYAYAPGAVERSSWPGPCGLLTTNSAAAAIGTAVTTKAFHARCFYIPGNDSFPTLTVTILGIGSDQRDTFDRVRDENARFKPRSIDRVGKDAVTYPVTGSPTVNLDLLADQGAFEVAVRSPVGNKLSVTDAERILVKVGTTLAAEFAR